VKVKRVSTAAAAGLLCLLLGAGVLPDTAVVAQDGPRRNYIVTVDVPDAGAALRTTQRAGRRDARARATDARRVTGSVTARHDVKPRHRYSVAITGFSARLTARQAAQLRSDGQVASVRPARRVRAAAQTVQPGIRRVNAGPGGPAPNVDVDIAIIDSGIGPAGEELNVRGGKDCLEDATGEFTDADTSANHGTHVAGIAAARDNGSATVGVAPGARLWAVRVLDTFGGDESTVLCGLDWAVATRLLPAEEAIDVINMSLQAPRIPFSESCSPGDPDHMHRAVCQADAAGITVVAAAGNAGFGGDRRAANVVPAAYDQVITVAAINDFDGEGGGQGSATCRGGGRDDRFGSYSRYGPDVDIVAPGTCVRSTAVSAGGTATRVLTGTSMATPHVSGAVARYLALHPGTSPLQMRRLVRAAGRLDWFSASDPDWSGMSDTRGPTRLVDVAALEAGQPDVRVWLSSERVRVAGNDTRRQLRVDVQRLGGYDGDVRLGLEGLPAGVGKSRFDHPGVDLNGLTGLSARLTLDLKRNGPQGRRTLTVRAEGQAGGPAGGRDIALIVDRRGPRVSDLAPRLRKGIPLATAGGAARVTMRWTISDKHSRVSKATLQRKLAGQPWRAVRSKLSHAGVTLKPGQANRFRVQSRDSLGNRRTSASIRTEMILRDSDAASWRLPASGDWDRRNARGAQRESLLAAQGATAGLRMAVSGKVVGIVAPVGPERGKLRVRIDGGEWDEVSLRQPSSRQRQVVYTRGLGPGAHLLEIQGLRGRTAVDALLIVR
jgi:hypothetical protein